MTRSSSSPASTASMSAIPELDRHYVIQSGVFSSITKSPPLYPSNVARSAASRLAKRSPAVTRSSAGSKDRYELYPLQLCSRPGLSCWFSLMVRTRV